MKIEGPAKAVLVLVGESDHWQGRPLYAAVVEKAREMGMAGATAMRGAMGFGANSHIHSAGILRLSDDLPVSVLVVDTPESVARFLPVLDEMVGEGVVLSWDVTVEFYRHSAR